MTRMTVEQDQVAVLDVLRRGGAYTVAELATQAGMSTRSVHDQLRTLRVTGQIKQASQYQYRFFRLATPHASVETPRMPERTAADVPRDIRFARSCYGHLAGWLGVT